VATLAPLDAPGWCLMWDMGCLEGRQRVALRAPTVSSGPDFASDRGERREHLSGIENVSGIEHLLQAAHQRNFLDAARPAEVGGLLEADAVLSRNRATALKVDYLFADVFAKLVRVGDRDRWRFSSSSGPKLLTTDGLGWRAVQGATSRSQFDSRRYAYPPLDDEKSQDLAAGRPLLTAQCASC
jgi:hypothetical protein